MLSALLSEIVCGRGFGCGLRSWSCWFTAKLSSFFLRSLLFLLLMSLSSILTMLYPFGNIFTKLATIKILSRSPTRRALFTSPVHNFRYPVCLFSTFLYFYSFSDLLVLNPVSLTTALVS